MSHGYGFYGRGTGGRGGRRARNMYSLTGAPGWLRFGFSPGWVGRTPTGLPPAAEFLAQAGNVPDFLQYLQQRGIPSGSSLFFPYQGFPVPMSGLLTPDQEREFLASQIELMEQQTKRLRERLNELLSKKKDSQEL